MSFSGLYSELLGTTDTAEIRCSQYQVYKNKGIALKAQDCVRKLFVRDRERWQKRRADRKDKCAYLRKAELQVLVITL